MKKLLSLTLAAIMSLSLLSGCSNPADTGKDETGKKESTTVQQPKEPAKFTWMTSENTTVQPIKPDLLVLKELEKRCNVKIEWQPVPDANYKEKLKIVIASGELPDVITLLYGVTVKDLNMMGDNGQLADYTKMLDKLPNIKKVFDNVTGLKAMYTSNNNKIYCIPAVNEEKGLSSVNREDLIYRKDMFDKAGITKLPTTNEELLVTLRELKAKLGFPPVLVDTVTKLTDLFSERFDANFMNYDFDKQELRFNAVSEERKKLLQRANLVVKEGLVDPDFVAMNRSQLNEKKIGNKFALTKGQLSWADNDTVEGKKNNPDFDLQILGRMKNDDGSIKVHTPNNPIVYWDGGIVSSKAKNQEAIFKTFDFIFSPEGQELLHWGVEGVTFTKDASGKKVPKPEATGSARGTFGMGLNALNQLRDSTYGEASWKPLERAWREKAFKEGRVNTKHTSDITIVENIMTQEEVDVRLQYFTPLVEYIKAQEAKFIIGQRSFDTWEAYRKELKDLGSDKIYEIYKAGFKRLYNIK